MVTFLGAPKKGPDSGKKKEFEDGVYIPPSIRGKDKEMERAEYIRDQKKIKNIKHGK